MPYCALSSYWEGPPGIFTINIISILTLIIYALKQHISKKLKELGDNCKLTARSFISVYPHLDPKQWLQRVRSSLNSMLLCYCISYVTVSAMQTHHRRLTLADFFAPFLLLHLTLTATIKLLRSRHATQV